MSSLMTGLKCSFCGSEIKREILWCELPQNKHDFCDINCKRKYMKGHNRNREVDIMDLVGKGYYVKTAPKPCKEKGIMFCTSCTYPDCILKEETLSKLY